jgi:hypothetical protein
MVNFEILNAEVSTAKYNRYRWPEIAALIRQLQPLSAIAIEKNGDKVQIITELEIKVEQFRDLLQNSFGFSFKSSNLRAFSHLL